MTHGPIPGWRERIARGEKQLSQQREPELEWTLIRRVAPAEALEIEREAKRRADSQYLKDVQAGCY